MASIIKADNIQKVSDGSNIIKKCGSTTTIGSGACSPIVICGSTVTLGRCGGTVTLACGATQSGFGQTYSAVAYCTTAKTSPFTAAAGTGYFVNTTCGAVTVTLPASPTAGDVVSFKDYAGQWNTNAVTLCNNGNKINGACATASLNTQNQSVTLIYVDATKGWQDIQDSTAGVSGVGYIVATGGTITCCGDYKIHTFTSDGCFSVTNAGTPTGSTTVDYLVVAGGGGGAADGGGGGGAGGYRESGGTASGCYAVSPLGSSPSPVAALPVSVQTYPITVGAGGVGAICGSTTVGAPGSVSTFSTITSAGGGRGGGGTPACLQAQAGGSGGGTRNNNSLPGGAGNTPPVSPPQGNDGGSGVAGNFCGAGGGGATAAGTPGPSGPKAGGAGATSSINNISTTRAGGGGGGKNGPAGAGGAGGPGGGGAGGQGSSPGPSTNGVAGTVNTGGGGGGSGGGSPGRTGGAGGSGVVIIRYRYK